MLESIVIAAILGAVFGLATLTCIVGLLSYCLSERRRVVAACRSDRVDIEVGKHDIELPVLAMGLRP